MILRPDLARAILRGKKTQARLPIKPHKPPASPYIQRRNGTKKRRPLKHTTTHNQTAVLACSYQPGRTYAVQTGRHHQPIGRLLITDITTQALGDITLRDAIAEGHRTTHDFKTHWLATRDTNWYQRTQAKHPEDDEIPEHLIQDRYQTHHAHKHAWVLTITPDNTDHNHLLRAQMGTLDDYTENPTDAAQGEPEALNPTDLHHITKAAHARDQKLQDDVLIRERRTIETALRTLEDHLHPNPHTTRRIEVLRRELRLLDRDLKAA
jgi:hypothetical protein